MDPFSPAQEKLEDAGASVMRTWSCPPHPPDSLHRHLNGIRSVSPTISEPTTDGNFRENDNYSTCTSQDLNPTQERGGEHEHEDEHEQQFRFDSSARDDFPTGVRSGGGSPTSTIGGSVSRPNEDVPGHESAGKHSPSPVKDPSDMTGTPRRSPIWHGSASEGNIVVLNIIDEEKAPGHMLDEYDDDGGDGLLLVDPSKRNAKDMKLSGRPIICRTLSDVERAVNGPN